MGTIILMTPFVCALMGVVRATNSLLVVRFKLLTVVSLMIQFVIWCEILDV